MKHLLHHFKTLTKHPQNAEELKGLILQLAVQGKLTENWRQENKSISTNLDEIAKSFNIKKSELIAHSSEIEDFEVPSSWTKVKFSLSFEMKGGSQPPKSKFVDSPREGYIRLFQIRDFGKKPVPVYVPSDSVSKICSEEDIMIGRYGASIGKVFYGKNGAYNVALVRLIWDRNVLLQDFVYQIFSSHYMQEFFQNCSRSAQAGFNKTDMGELNLPIPPLEEQKAIVAIVNELFAEVEKLEEQTKTSIQLKEDFVSSALTRLSQAENINKEWQFLQSNFSEFFTKKENVKQLRETILHLAVQGKLTSKWRATNYSSLGGGAEGGGGIEPASELLKRIQTEKKQLIAQKKIKKEKPLPPVEEHEKPYELPEGWVWCRLTELTNVGTGSTPSKTRLDYYGGEIPWYTSSATNDDFAKVQDVLITQKALDETNCKIFPKGTLIIAMYGQGKTRGQISELVIPGATNQAIAGMVFYDSSKETKQYLKYFFQKFYHEIRLLAEGGAQPNLNVGKVKATLIPLPPLEEQKAIVKQVNSLMALCDSLEKHIDNSQTQIEQLMQSCLKEVFEHSN